jgi:nitroreductase
MELVNAVKGRRSIRKFKSDNIPQEILHEILETARWAPSGGNKQPWEFYVLTGKQLEDFKRLNHESLIKEESVSPDVPWQQILPETMQKRVGDLWGNIATILNSKPVAKESQSKVHETMSLFFGAPCLIVTCIPTISFVEYAMLDVGCILQTLCLLAYEKGIGTCIMAVAVRNPNLLRKMLSIPEDRKIIAGVAMGYPDWDSKINKFERKRADINEYVKWVD